MGKFLKDNPKRFFIRMSLSNGLLFKIREVFLLKKLMTLLLVFMLSFCFVGNVFAADGTVSNANNQEQINVEKGKQIQKDIKILDKYVTRSDDGTFQLNVPQKVKSQIANDEFNQINDSMNQVNTRIKEGTLKSTSNLSVFDAKDTSFTLQAGINQVLWFWWGYQVWLNHTATYNTSHALNLTAAASCVTIAIPGAGAIGAIVAGYCWYHATLMDWNDAGRGIEMSFLVGATSPFWYAGQ